MARRGDELAERLLDFAARVGKVVNGLPEIRLGRHIAGQLVRSGRRPHRITPKPALPRARETSFTSSASA